MYLFEIHEFVIIRSGKSKNLRFLAGILGADVPYRLSPFFLPINDLVAARSVGNQLERTADFLLQEFDVVTRVLRQILQTS